MQDYEIKSGGHAHKVMRLDYCEWMDGGGLEPDKLGNLVTLITVFQEGNKDAADQCVLIHCKAGVGRTGTLIVACALSKMIEEGKVTKENLLTTIETLILEGRKQRGPLFVQTNKQFITLYNWGMQALENKN